LTDSKELEEDGGWIMCFITVEMDVGRQVIRKYGVIF